MNPRLHAILSTEPGRNWLEEHKTREAYGLKVYPDAREEEADIYMLDMIDSWWGVSDIDFVDALKQCGDKDIRLSINSPGGDAFVGLSIMNLLKNYKGKVTAVVTGLCASAAADISLGADEVYMMEGTHMLVHNTRGMVWGTKDEMRAAADELETMDDSFTDLYQQRSGMDEDELKELMDEDRLMNADETVEKGFANGMWEEPEDEERPGDHDEEREEEEEEPTEEERQAREAVLRDKDRRARQLRMLQLQAGETGDPSASTDD